MYHLHRSEALCLCTGVNLVTNTDHHHDWTEVFIFYYVQVNTLDIIHWGKCGIVAIALHFEMKALWEGSAIKKTFVNQPNFSSKRRKVHICTLVTCVPV